MSDSLRPHGLDSPWNSPGQNTWVGSLSLLQGIIPTQGSNPGLPHCGRILHQLSHQGNPRMLEWVAYPFSSRSSQSRNQTGVSCIAGRFFTDWTMREVCLPCCVVGVSPSRVGSAGLTARLSWGFLSPPAACSIPHAGFAWPSSRPLWELELRARHKCWSSGYSHEE